VVFRARDLTLKRTVALKIFVRLGTSPPLMDEARGRRAQSSNVCTIFAVDDSDGISMIVMEHVGRPAAPKRFSTGKLRWKMPDVARQIAMGIQRPRHKIVHGI
jgi:hypothetical protein